MSPRLRIAGASLAVLLGIPYGFGRVSAKPPDLPLVENDALTSPPVITQPSEAAPFPAPAPTVASLFQVRPSVRRTMAACLLFGVHPLLALAPTEEYVNEEESDEAPAPDQAITTSQPAPSEAPSGCPYIRQEQCVPDRQAALFADVDVSHDVLQNLQALRQSRELLDNARELARGGRLIEALEALDTAGALCPGSRLEREIQTAAAELLASATAEQREVAQKLSRPVSLNYINAPLGKILDDLREWTDANIFVDQAALDQQEVSLERLVSIKANNVTLRSALKLVLKEAHLTYVVKDEVVQITTEQARHIAIEPTLPPVDANVPAVFELLNESEDSGPPVRRCDQKQETPPSFPPHGSLEFEFGLDGSFRLFGQFQHGDPIWHVEYNDKGLSVWAGPDGGLE